MGMREYWAYKIFSKIVNENNGIIKIIVVIKWATTVKKSTIHHPPNNINSLLASANSA